MVFPQYAGRVFYSQITQIKKKNSHIVTGAVTQRYTAAVCYGKYS